MSSNKLITIEEGKDYTPVVKGILQLGGTKTPSVVSLHCTCSNKSDIYLMLVGDEDHTIFPPGSFLQGHVYNMFLAKMTKMGGAGFVGYLQSNY